MGKSKTISQLEVSDEPPEKSDVLQEVSPPNGKTDKNPDEIKSVVKKTKALKEESTWAKDAWVVSWLGILPLLAAEDLRPYVFIANQQARMAMGTALGPLLPIINRLMGVRMAVASMEEELKKLNPTEAAAVMQELASRVRTSDLKSDPPGAEGIKVLVKAQPSLQPEVITFLRLLPVEELGLWVTTGWAQTFSNQQQEFRSLLDSWAAQTVNRPLAAAARSSIPTP